MKKKKSIHILDVTLREGSYLLDFQLKPSDAAHLVDYMDHAKVEYIEMGHGCGLGAIHKGYPAAATDPEYLEAARPMAKKTQLGVIATVGVSSIPDLAEIHSSLDFIRVAAKVNEIAKASVLVEQAKKYKLPTFVQMMGTPSLPPSKAAEAAKKAEKMGADVVYIVDSMGSLTPATVRDYVKAVRSKVRIPIGFHAHNNLGLAIANSLEAARAGCQWLDASLLGVGRQAGNAQLEILALLLEREGYSLPLDIPLIFNIAESIVPTIFKNYKGVEPHDSWAASLNLDLFPAWHFQKLAVLTGLDSKAFVQEISRIKNFYFLDDQGRLNAISQRFGLPVEQLVGAIKSPYSL